MSRSLLKRLRSFFVLAMLAFALACTARNTPTPLASIALDNVYTVPLGGGLNGQFNYSPDFAFVDAVKTAGRFYSLTADHSFDDKNNPPLDSQGWPTTDFGFYVNETAPQPGIYKLSFSSKAQPSVELILASGAVMNSNYNTNTHIFTADIVVDSQGTPGGPGQFVLRVFNTNGGATNIKLIRPGYDPVTPPVFTTPYLNLIKELKPNLLRFMDWRTTNGNVETDWSERSLPTDATQEILLTKTISDENNTYPVTSSKGIAWEYSIELANELYKDMWINVPILATDDYVMQLATLLKSNLNPNLKVYVEYSNEVWNDAFLQTHINRRLAMNEVAVGGSTLNYDGSTDNVIWGDRRVAKRLKEISDIFSQVFGASAINTRIRPVLAYQLVAWHRFDDQLAFINQKYSPPKQFFYAIAVAPYFGMGNADSNANLTVDQVLEALSSSIDSYQNSSTLQDVQTVATYYGLKLAAYEGGPDTFGPNNIAAKQAATLAWQMKDIVKKYLNIWYSKGGDQFNWFTIGAGSFDTKYGTWSITHDLNNLNEPKELAFAEVITSGLPAVTVGSVLPGEVDARGYLGSSQPYTDPYVRFINHSKFDYLVRVPTAGTYSLKVSLGTSTPGSTLDLLVNNNVVATLSAPANGLQDSGDSKFVDTEAITLNLQAGLNVVRLNVPTYRPYNINSLKFYNGDGSRSDNTLPIIGMIYFSNQQSIGQNTSFSQQFTVYDAETSPVDLTVSGSSDNTTLVANSSIVFTRSTTNSGLFSFTITPTANQSGVANITLTLKDSGGLTRSVNFQLTVK